jgi:hypothetical protein
MEGSVIGAAKIAPPVAANIIPMFLNFLKNGGAGFYFF